MFQHYMGFCGLAPCPLRVYGTRRTRLSQRRTLSRTRNVNTLRHLVADRVEALLPSLHVAWDLRPLVKLVIEERRNGARGRGGSWGFHSWGGLRWLELEKKNDRRVDTQRRQHDLVVLWQDGADLGLETGWWRTAVAVAAAHEAGLHGVGARLGGGGRLLEEVEHGFL